MVGSGRCWQHHRPLNSSSRRGHSFRIHRENIEGTRVVLGIEGSRKPYYSCPDIAKAMWKDALIHKDDQDVIYWVKLEIATHQQSKTIGNLLDLPDASNSAVVSLVQLLAPDLSRCTHFIISSSCLLRYRHSR